MVAKSLVYAKLGQKFWFKSSFVNGYTFPWQLTYRKTKFHCWFKERNFSSRSQNRSSCPSRVVNFRLERFGESSLAFPNSNYCDARRIRWYFDAKTRGRPSKRLLGGIFIVRADNGDWVCLFTSAAAAKWAKRWERLTASRPAGIIIEINLMRAWCAVCISSGSLFNAKIPEQILGVEYYIAAGVAVSR